LNRKVRKEREGFVESLRVFIWAVPWDLMTLSDDVTPELARAVIKQVEVYGVFQAPKAVKEALADRTR
jgi:hypothetical protein